MRQCAHERHIAEALCQEQPKFLGTSLHGRTRFVSPFCGMSKKRNRKRAVATQDKENSLNEKRKRRLEGKSRESEKADGRPSGSAGDSASLSFSARLARLTACACLRRGVSEPHLSMTSTRRGAKITYTDQLYVVFYISFVKNQLACCIVKRFPQYVLHEASGHHDPCVHTCLLNYFLQVCLI